MIVLTRPPTSQKRSVENNSSFLEISFKVCFALFVFFFSYGAIYDVPRLLL